MGEITKFVISWPNAGQQTVYLPTGYYCVFRKSLETDAALTLTALDEFLMKLIKSGRKSFSVYMAAESAGCEWKKAAAALAQLEESGKMELVMSATHRYYKLVLPGNSNDPCTI